MGKELLPVLSVRDLGMQVDATLSYDEHITNTVSACIASLSQISRVKYIFDTRTLLNIINALVFSKLYYCSSAWSNTSKKNVRKLQNVQNFAARIVSGTRKFDHVTPVLKELNWLSVSQMLLFRDGVLAFKCVKGLSPSYVSDRFTTRSMVHTRNTRNKDKLNIPRISQLLVSVLFCIGPYRCGINCHAILPTAQALSFSRKILGIIC